MKKLVSDFDLPVLLQGENVNLCLPSLKYAEESSWYSWFNDVRTTRFLEQGIFPNSPENQVDFLKQARLNNDRLILIISDKKQYVGTISFSFINLIKKTADIAMLIGERSDSENSDLIALESMAMMTDYGFNRMGLIRISAGQHEKLYKWQRRLELLGYRIDGYKRHGFIKAGEVTNSISISVVKSDHDLLTKNRGQLWDSSINMRKRIDLIPEASFTNQFKSFLSNEGEKYYNTIFNL